MHHGHLAHALNQTTRALDCYRVAASLSEEGSFVALSAKAGEIILRIGAHARQDSTQGVDVVDVKEAINVATKCRSIGGTLEAVGSVIEASLTGEIIKAK